MKKTGLYLRSKKTKLQKGDVLSFEMDKHCFSITREGEMIYFSNGKLREHKRLIYSINNFGDFYELCLLLVHMGVFEVDKGFIIDKNTEKRFRIEIA
jgi:hypothetical protein